MKRIIKTLTLIALLCVAKPVAAIETHDSTSFATRYSAKVDYKIRKGLHVFVSEELRFEESMRFERSMSEVGLSYKLTDYLKAAVSYTAIGAYDSETDKVDDWRHRFTGELTGSFKIGQWKFSLRESVQGTYKASEVNNYQRPQTKWVLRSRLKASYGFRTVPIKTYAYIEPRLFFNGAKWSEEATGDQFGFAEFIGHKDMYVDRLRGAIGLEWKLNSRHAIDIYGLYDYITDKEIDARKEGSLKGVVLKDPITVDKIHKISVGIGYTFDF